MDTVLAQFIQHPMPWHEEQWQMLNKRLQSNTLPHALLLQGGYGIGKYTFALAFASRLLCTQPYDSVACGHCKSCELLKAGTHPDVQIVQPEAHGKPIKISQIRAINEFTRKTAQQGQRRIIIIDPAEAMNINAANALLKNLEEPGVDTQFLLVSTRKGDMPATIRSRCQIVTFGIPDHAIAYQWLKQHIADDDTVQQLLSMSGGAPLYARSLFDQNKLKDHSDLVNQLSELLQERLSTIAMAKQWSSYKDIPELLQWLSEILNDAIRLSSTQDSHFIHNQAMIRMVSFLAQQGSLIQLLQLNEQVLQHRHQLLQGATLNIQMLLEYIFAEYVALME